MSQAATPVPLSRRVDPPALLALFRIAVAQLVRGRRLLVLALLFALPTAVALLARRYNPDYSPAEAEEALVFYLIPQALVPLTALVLASGMIQDEVEDQTLTYLLIRPIPRPLIYLVKLGATLVVAGALAFGFGAVAMAAIHWRADATTAAELIGRAARVGGLLVLATWAYVALFGLLGLVVRRTLAVGVGYIVLFEGVFANIDFIVRKLTVMYYARVLAARWLGLKVESWSIDLDTAPTGRAALLTLLLAGAVAVGLAAWIFGRREFRLKTPEGG